MKKEIIFVGFIILVFLFCAAVQAQEESSSQVVAQETTDAVVDMRAEIESDQKAIKAQKREIKVNAEAAHQEESQIKAQVKEAVKSGDKETAKQLRTQLKSTHQENVQEKKQDKAELKEEKKKLKKDTHKARVQKKSSSGRK
ncbi:MAG: hypothetical protein WCX16_06840 [Candidatus Omnitrophota bacterium]